MNDNSGTRRRRRWRSPVASSGTGPERPPPRLRSSRATTEGTPGAGRLPPQSCSAGSAGMPQHRVVASRRRVDSWPCGTPKGGARPSCLGLRAAGGRATTPGESWGIARYRCRHRGCPVPKSGPPPSTAAPCPLVRTRGLPPNAARSLEEGIERATMRCEEKQTGDGDGDERLRAGTWTGRWRIGSTPRAGLAETLASTDAPARSGCSSPAEVCFHEAQHCCSHAAMETRACLRTQERTDCIQCDGPKPDCDVGPRAGLLRQGFARMLKIELRFQSVR
mmetsp:Transcript_6131/g.11721  ORF Transcript_6131/g.11721 Transcript_6131/m.11721 type:complete len:278 (+) Transcript_6131:2290-3123(+)